MAATVRAPPAKRLESFGPLQARFATCQPLPFTASGVTSLKYALMGGAVIFQSVTRTDLKRGEKMKLARVVPLVISALVLGASSAAMAQVNVGVNIGVPGPVYVAPAPVYAPPPPPVYAAPPPPVVYEPAPVYGGPSIIIGWHGDRYWDGRRYWDHDDWYRHHHERDHDHGHGWDGEHHGWHHGDGD
jgi:hypothetical protein